MYIAKKRAAQFWRRYHNRDHGASDLADPMGKSPGPAAGIAACDRPVLPLRYHDLHYRRIDSKTKGNQRR